MPSRAKRSGWSRKRTRDRRPVPRTELRFEDPELVFRRLCPIVPRRRQAWATTVAPPDARQRRSVGVTIDDVRAKRRQAARETRRLRLRRPPYCADGADLRTTPSPRAVARGGRWRDAGPQATRLPELHARGEASAERTCERLRRRRDRCCRLLPSSSAHRRALPTMTPSDARARAGNERHGRAARDVHVGTETAPRTRVSLATVDRVWPVPSPVTRIAAAMPRTAASGGLVRYGLSHPSSAECFLRPRRPRRPTASRPERPRARRGASRPPRPG